MISVFFRSKIQHLTRLFAWTSFLFLFAMPASAVTCGLGAELQNNSDTDNFYFSFTDNTCTTSAPSEPYMQLQVRNGTNVHVTTETELFGVAADANIVTSSDRAEPSIFVIELLTESRIANFDTAFIDEGPGTHTHSFSISGEDYVVTFHDLDVEVQGGPITYGLVEVTGSGVGAPSEDNSEMAAELISGFQEIRGQMILQNGPRRDRRIGRLNGDRRNDGGVYMEGAALRNSSLPFRLDLSSDRQGFSYSSRDTVARNSRPSLGLPKLTSTIVADGVTTAATNVHASGASEQIVANTTGGRNASPVVSSSAASMDDLGTGSREFRDDSPWEFWAEGTFAKMEYGDRDGDFTILHVGVDYLATPNMLLGLGLQYDKASLSGISDHIEGAGYMIGPYLTARLKDSLYFDARFAWGESDNDISPLGTYTDSYDSERKLLTAALIGEYMLGGTQFSPEARLSWYEETSDAYVDSQNVAISSETTSFGSFELTPMISHSYDLSGGAALIATAGVSAIWTFDVDTSSGTSSVTEGTRGRLEFGADYSQGPNYLVSGSVFYDGIGQSDQESWGLSLGLDIRF